MFSIFYATIFFFFYDYYFLTVRPKTTPRRVEGGGEVSDEREKKKEEKKARITLIKAIEAKLFFRSSSDLAVSLSVAGYEAAPRVAAPPHVDDAFGRKTGNPNGSGPGDRENGVLLFSSRSANNTKNIN